MWFQIFSLRTVVHSSRIISVKHMYCRRFRSIDKRRNVMTLEQKFPALLSWKSFRASWDASFSSTATSRGSTTSETTTDSRQGDLISWTISARTGRGVCGHRDRALLFIYAFPECVGGKLTSGIWGEAKRLCNSQLPISKVQDGPVPWDIFETFSNSHTMSHQSLSACQESTTEVDIPRWLSLLIVEFSVSSSVFLALVLNSNPYLTSATGYADGGDMYSHQVEALYLKELLQSGATDFWFDEVTLGYPYFLTYHPFPCLFTSILMILTES